MVSRDEVPEAVGVRSNRWLYVVAWLPYLAIYLAAFMTYPISLGMALRNVIAYVLPNALLGALVLRLSRHRWWPIGQGARFFAAQAGLATAFALASIAVWLALYGLDSLLFERVLRVRIDPRILPWRVLNDLLVYGTLAGFAHAWRHAAASREQAARAARADALRARAELEAMRSQLNPHFILNTFHALMGLVRREPAVAEEALERLGDLLRYSLRVQREGLDEVRLGEEWAFVQAYLELERLRLGDRLRASFEAAPALLERQVPTFALQTLVENSVRHAIAPRAQGGRLAVTAHETDGRLRLEVVDDGPSPRTQPAGESNGVGLQLLRERLSALYGREARLELRLDAGGACAILELPARGTREAR